MEIALHQSSSTKTWFVKVGGEELMDVIGQVSICFWPYSVFYNKSDENLIRNKKKKFIMVSCIQSYLQKASGAAGF